MKVSIIAAVTIDGKIAKTLDPFLKWTGTADKKMFAAITKKAKIMIMGSKTFDVIGKPLPERQTIVMTRNIKRISKKKNLIFTNKSAEKIIEKLNTQGVKQVLVCGGSQINYLFITKKLVDELIITFSPLLFGVGVPFLSNSVDLELQLRSLTLIDNDSICAVYKIKNYK